MIAALYAFWFTRPLKKWLVLGITFFLTLVASTAYLRAPDWLHIVLLGVLPVVVAGCYPVVIEPVLLEPLFIFCQRARLRHATLLASSRLDMGLERELAALMASTERLSRSMLSFGALPEKANEVQALSAALERELRAQISRGSREKRAHPEVVIEDLGSTLEYLSVRFPKQPPELRDSLRDLSALRQKLAELGWDRRRDARA